MTTTAIVSARLAIVMAARDRLANASFTPSTTAGGRRSAVAARAAREGFVLTVVRPRAIASSTPRRPARQAGTAVKTATTAATPSTPAATVTRRSPLGVDVPSSVAVGSSRSGLNAIPSAVPTTPVASARIRFSTTNSAVTPPGVNPAAFSSPMSRREARIRPPMALATMKPTASSAARLVAPRTTDDVEVRSITSWRSWRQSQASSRSGW